MYWLPDDGNVWEQIAPESHARAGDRGRTLRGAPRGAEEGAARGPDGGGRSARGGKRNEANMIETINLQHFPNPQLLWGVFSL